VIRAERIGGLIIGGIGVALFIHTLGDQYSVRMFGLQYGPVYFPRIVLAVIIFLSLIYVWLPGKLEYPKVSPRYVRLVLGVTALALYVGLFDFIGFALSTLLFGLIFQAMVKERWSAKSVLWATGLTVICWAVFEYVLKIPLPAGSIWG
jgi:putative tricarboxylic transport membrane protein